MVICREERAEERQYVRQHSVVLVEIRVARAVGGWAGTAARARCLLFPVRMWGIIILRWKAGDEISCIAGVELVSWALDGQKYGLCWAW